MKPLENLGLGSLRGIAGIQTTRNPQTVTKRRGWCSGSSRHNLRRCARSEGASGSCSSSLVSTLGVCARKDVKVGLVDGRGGRRGCNLSRNEQNTTFKTRWTALSAAALRSARNASRVREAINERPCMEGRTARRPPVNGTSPKTSSASRDAPYFSPASVIFVRQCPRKWLMVLVFKANFQSDWTNRQGKNIVRETRCPWVNSIISGRSPPLICTPILIAMQSHQT